MLVVAGGFAGGIAGSRLWNNGPSSADAGRSAVTVRTVAVTPSGGNGSVDATAIVHSMAHSVVSIRSEITTDQGPWQTRSEAAGTGIVIDSHGDVLTNAHVVGDARTVEVALPGSSVTRTGSVIGADPTHDVALVRVANASGLTPAPVAASDNAQVGEGVVAIGNALALEGSLTVTEGIVSARNRSIQTDESASLTGLLQTDAPISSGNSGGPLVDAHGVVIGMNTAVASSSDQVQASNIGFAIPIRTALAEVAHWMKQ